MRRLFAVLLNSRESRSLSRRFALYRPGKDGLEVLWGDDAGRRRYPHMIYSQAANLPVFHFKVTPEKRHKIDRAEDALCELASDLARFWDQPVTIQLLNGWPGFVARSPAVNRTVPKCDSLLTGGSIDA